MVKSQQDNSTQNATVSPALQTSIIEAVSQASKNIPNDSKAGLNGKAFNMTLVVNPAQQIPSVAAPSLPSAFVATPASNTVALPAMPAGMEGMSQEYMAAVAVSLQKTKELEEAQHQAAIQKTLTMALEKKESDRKLKEEQDKISAIQVAQQVAETQKKSDAEQKMHDELIRRSIELAKKQKVQDDAKSKVEAEKMA